MDSPHILRAQPAPRRIAALQDALEAKSLRFWVGVGMAIALAPLMLSAGAGYLLLDRGVMAPVHDIAFRQREQILPTLHLRLLVWDTLIPVDEYVEEGNPIRPAAYRSLRGQIESGFADLLQTLDSSPAARTLAERARDSWTLADSHATELISVPAGTHDLPLVESLQRFHGAVVATSDRLETVYEQLAGRIDEDHDIAVLSYERSMGRAAIAGGVSLLAIVCGVLLIGRIISNSVDRLVVGATRFAEGDRAHRIEVQLPPELRRVAEEFNHMIGRIHESEEALADLAFRDSLTGLCNRRAFEEALADAEARLKRFGEPSCLLAIDIDHFKRVNDSRGHAAGDEVLRRVARTMTQALRPFDKPFRIGGEEFAVLLPGTLLADGRNAAERLRLAIASTPVLFEGHDISVTISIGLAELARAVDRGAVVKAADAALYQAKTLGRNRVVVSGPRELQDQHAA